MLNVKEKYKWRKEGNSYRICRVPIFRCFQDEKRGKVDKAIAEEIVKNFQNGIENGYYPRTHIGHQNLESFDNKPGVGFLDNIDFDGEKFYADIAEIDEKTFKQMENYKYPYRSVEYNPIEKKIEGLALLESVPPYFQFPILALEQEHFSKRGNNTKNLLVFFQGENMPEEKEKKEDKPPEDEEESSKEIPAEGNNEEEVEEKTEENSQADEVADEIPEEVLDSDTAAPVEPANAILQKIEGAWPAIEKMLEFFDDFQNEAMDREIEEDEIEDQQPVQGQQSQQPMKGQGMAQEPIAMQKFLNAFDRFEKRLDKLDGEIQQFKKVKNTDFVLDKLRNICNDNPRINFAQESAFIEKFESNKDKLHYVNKLAMQETVYEEHNITQFAKNFKYEKRDEVLQKFSKESNEMQQFAKRVYIDYKDSVAQSNEKEAIAFSKRFPTAEKYINFAIEMEKMNPGSYNPKYK